MERLFIVGYSKSQESFGGHQAFRPVRRFHSTKVWIFRKELKYFLRDSSEWSQFFMIAALIVVYLYNFKVLPLDRAPMPMEFVSNLIAFANIGLSGFLAASLAARFVYPSISAEQGAYYLIAVSPLSWRRYLWYKYQFYCPPFTLLSLGLIIISNHLLQIQGPMHWVSVCIGLVSTWTTLGLALGFGMYFADFKSETKAGAMEPGAILFLFSAILYQVVVLLSGMSFVAGLVRKTLVGQGVAFFDVLLLIAWGGGVVLVSFLLVFGLCTRASSRQDDAGDMGRSGLFLFWRGRRREY